MAVNVDIVYKTVLLILNKEQRGNLTPDEFNKVATQVQLEIFESYLIRLINNYVDQIMIQNMVIALKMLITTYLYLKHTVTQLTYQQAGILLYQQPQGWALRRRHLQVTELQYRFLLHR